MMSAATKLSDGKAVPLNFQKPASLWDIDV